MKRRRGFSLIEVMMTTAILGMVIAGATSLTINMIKSFNWTSAQLDSDQSASLALQNISRDLQEAKQITLMSSTYVRVFYPQVAGDGSYVQNILDTVNYVDFYRGTTGGVASPTGTALLRKPATGPARVICRNVTNLVFTNTTPSSLQVTLRTQNSKGAANTSCQMVQRSIFMRNY